LNASEIILRRLSNQQITRQDFDTPSKLLHWMLAMQAQDFAMAKWAMGLRLKGLNETDIDKAFNEGSILRTHLLRPTWHFVCPSDIRWLTRFTAPRIRKIMKSSFVKMEMDAKMLQKGNALLAKCLQGNNHLDRNELKSIFQKSKLNADKERMSFFLMEAELEEIVCSGPRKGKQFTYALLDERAPNAKSLSRPEALMEICKRYFRSRGPATIADMAYWSGLTMKEIHKGVEVLGTEFSRVQGEKTTLIYALNADYTNMNLKATFLVPDYDEYGMSYKDRGAFQLRGEGKTDIRAEGNTAIHFFVVNGKYAGNWTRNFEKNIVKVNTKPTAKLSVAAEARLNAGIRKYENFFKSRQVKIE